MSYLTSRLLIVCKTSKKQYQYHWIGKSFRVSFIEQAIVWSWGGALRYRGGSHLRYVFRGRRGLFLRTPHVRDFVKEGYFFVPRYEVWGSKSPYNPRNIRGSDAE